VVEAQAVAARAAHPSTEIQQLQQELEELRAGQISAAATQQELQQAADSSKLQLLALQEDRDALKADADDYKRQVLKQQLEVAALQEGAGQLEQVRQLHAELQDQLAQLSSRHTAALQMLKLLTGGLPSFVQTTRLYRRPQLQASSS